MSSDRSKDASEGASSPPWGAWWPIHEKFIVCPFAIFLSESFEISISIANLPCMINVDIYFQFESNDYCQLVWFLLFSHASERGGICISIHHLDWTEASWKHVEFPACADRECVLLPFAPTCSACSWQLRTVDRLSDSISVQVAQMNQLLAASCEHTAFWSFLIKQPATLAWKSIGLCSPQGINAAPKNWALKTNAVGFSDGSFVKQLYSSLDLETS